MVKRIITGQLQTNTYLIIDKNSKDALIVDPAGDFDKIIECVSKLSLNIKGVLVTHGHFDHIVEVDQIKQYFNVKAYAHEKEAKMMSDPRKNLSAYFFGIKITANADKYIKDGEILDFGNDLVLKCILVSGHTSSSICFYNEANNFVITGDTLMANSIGRTDLNNSNTSFLAKNINDRLMVLPNDTIVYPGHGESSKIETERIYNPYLSLAGE